MKKLMDLKGVKKLDIAQQKSISGGRRAVCSGRIPPMNQSFLRPECLSNRDCMNPHKTCCYGECI